MSEVNEDDINERRSDELNRNVSSSSGSRFPSLTRLAVYFGMLVIAFLAGFIPMWLNARANAKERDTAQRELRLTRMENALASASLDARRGEYEPARQATSTFFNALDAEIKRETDSAIDAAQRTNVQRFNAQRDEIITLLARNDAASADRLLDMHVAFRNAVKPASPAP